MKIINEWVDYLKKQQDKLKTFIEKEYNVNVEELMKANKKTIYSDSLKATKLKEFRMACIMDRFTLDSYKPECVLLELTPENWQREIEEFEPEMIFIESAWQGKDGLWYRKIANGSAELYQMTGYCQERGIPIVFWNKEDPIYTDTFMPAARCADFVFTTDIDCVKKYKNILGHDRVYFLHFAAQPLLHNPIEKYNRKDRFCFAGAYYHRYPNRAKTFDTFAEVFMKSKGLDIYDRNYNSPKTEFLFPAKYDSCILGNLDPSEIDIAYKGYNFGINMNSIEQSQTMFARRVFEMLASNTVTIGNYSRGVKNLFGDLTICTNDTKILEKDINNKCVDAVIYRKYRLQGLRKILGQHLYEDRLNYIVKQVFGKEIKRSLPRISLVAYPKAEELDRVLMMFRNQTYSNKHLYLIGDFDEINDNNIEILKEHEWINADVCELSQEGYVGVLKAENYYGSNYLLDLALTLRYVNIDGMGKGAYYSYIDSNYIVENISSAYKYVPKMKIDRSVFKKSIFDGWKIEELFEGKDIEGDNIFSIDEFNFCENYKKGECTFVGDILIADKGIDLREIENVAENIVKDIWDDDVVCINKDEIERYCGRIKNTLVKTSINNENWRIESELEEAQIHYIYLNEYFDVTAYQKGNNINVQYAGRGNLDVLGVFLFYDEKKGKLEAAFPKVNALTSCSVPENAKYFKIGFRISGKGVFDIKEICLGLKHNLQELSCFLSRSNKLVLSNNYPSYQSLYRNMFVHKRIMAYKEEGVVCDIMRMNVFCKNEFSEFEGINIIDGQADRLRNILNDGHIDTVCVHFLDRSMWEVLKDYGRNIRILVWLHGAEIQPWWRREYNYTTASELEHAKKESADRQAFWSEVFKEIDKYNIHFIFVSQYFADEIFEDNGVTLPQDKYSIIHNCIDTDMFKFEKKDEEQRKKLLSIRPYASNKYANDLTVKCIEELAKEPFFKELQFRIVGNGELFKKTTAPLKKYSNVILEQNFLRQDEIADLHKAYGIFLTPTRMDAQGVSRDEAMSSGLIPVTNAVTAIPEFVDESCGILAPGEGYKEMAQGIKELYYNADLFAQMSEKAAQRVRKQSAKQFTITREVEIINRN